MSLKNVVKYRKISKISPVCLKCLYENPGFVDFVIYRIRLEKKHAKKIGPIFTELLSENEYTN